MKCDTGREGVKNYDFCMTSFMNSFFFFLAVSVYVSFNSFVAHLFIYFFFYFFFLFFFFLLVNCLKAQPMEKWFSRRTVKPFLMS